MSVTYENAKRSSPEILPPDISPTVSRIVSRLKDRITSGAYKEREWLPAERTLAEEFGVSRILIRSAIKELERNGLITCLAHRRPLVRSSNSHTALTPLTSSAARRSLALWIWPHPSWPGSAMIIRGIQGSLGEEFRLVLGSAIGGSWEEMYVSEARFLRQIIRDRDIAGLILGYMGGVKNLPQLQALRAAGIPMVFLDHRPPAGFEADYVGVNNKRAAEHLVKHLLTLGHRSIAHISTFDTISTVSERLIGYRRALEHAGIAFRPELVEKDPGPPGSDPEKGCEALIGRLLALPDPPTAFFALNDVVALRIIAALREHGLRIPQDISVAGFDGIERWMPLKPFLTTAYQPFEGLGAQAVDLLLERMEVGPAAAFRHAILDTTLAIHESTSAISHGKMASEREAIMPRK